MVILVPIILYRNYLPVSSEDTEMETEFCSGWCTDKEFPSGEFCVVSRLIRPPRNSLFSSPTYLVRVKKEGPYLSPVLMLRLFKKVSLSICHLSHKSGMG